MTIYFVRSDCGRIKVGFTAAEEPSGRLRDLQVGSPRRLELIASCPGSQSEEGSLHRALAADNIHGEWFAPNKRMASLLAYVRRFNTTAGWSDAEANPEEWADFFKRYGRTTQLYELRGRRPSDVRWEIALAEWKEQPIPEPEMDSIWATWHCYTRESARPSVYHVQGPEDQSETSVAGWLTPSGDFLANAGQERTVGYLDDAGADRDREAVVWIGACLHQLSNPRSLESYSIYKKLPTFKELLAELDAKRRLRWHPMVTSPLPIDILLPEHCLLSTHDFIVICARHRRLVLGECRPVIAWREGASRSLRYREVAA